MQWSADRYPRRPIPRGPVQPASPYAADMDARMANYQDWAGCSRAVAAFAITPPTQWGEDQDYRYPGIFEATVKRLARDVITTAEGIAHAHRREGC